MSRAGIGTTSNLNSGGDLGEFKTGRSSSSSSFRAHCESWVKGQEYPRGFSSPIFLRGHRHMVLLHPFHRCFDSPVGATSKPCPLCPSSLPSHFPPLPLPGPQPVLSSPRLPYLQIPQRYILTSGLASPHLPSPPSAGWSCGQVTPAFTFPTVQSPPCIVPSPTPCFLSTSWPLPSILSLVLVGVGDTWRQDKWAEPVRWHQAVQLHSPGLHFLALRVQAPTACHAVD